MSWWRTQPASPRSAQLHMVLNWFEDLKRLTATK
jgi:hypothetical protein